MKNENEYIFQEILFIKFSLIEAQAKILIFQFRRESRSFYKQEMFDRITNIWKSLLNNSFTISICPQ